ncbi:MAG TPA: hypothetical protein VMR98_02595 [Candidatus Polarisedimenticolaceae bacterium]|nr:hypothetical protein [Candidatus Polarisedimenticolaceae bacterium]
MLTHASARVMERSTTVRVGWRSPDNPQTRLTEDVALSPEAAARHLAHVLRTHTRCNISIVELHASLVVPRITVRVPRGIFPWVCCDYPYMLVVYQGLLAASLYGSVEAFVRKNRMASNRVLEQLGIAPAKPDPVAGDNDISKPAVAVC